MALIDLDRPPPEPETAPRERSPRRIAGTVVLMLIAAGLGGLAVYRWQQVRDRSAFRVVVLADLSPSPPAFDGVVEPAGSDGQDGQVAIISHIDVVNMGAATVRTVAINIAALGMRPGAWMQMDRAIAPGRVASLTMSGSVDCGNNSLLRSAPATVEVIAADGAHRRVTATVDTEAWAGQVAQTCPKT